MLLMLLLASAAAGWAVVSFGTPAARPDAAGAVVAELSAFAERLHLAGREAAAALVRLGEGAVAAALPLAQHATDAAREALRDPRLGPPLVGGLGLAAGLAFGVLMGRRQARGRLDAPPREERVPPPAPPASLPPAPPPPAPPPPAAFPAAAPQPPLPGAPLLAGTVAHALLPAEEEAAPRQAESPKAEPAEAPGQSPEAASHAALIAGVLAILAEEMREEPRQAA
jgi:hypothetical protein